MITRRDTTRLLLGAAALLSLPGISAAATAQEWQRALEDALKSATARNAGTELTLVGFDFERSGGRARMSARTRMDWRPGFRSRKFTTVEASERAAFIRLVGDIVAEYRGANPDGIREVRFSQ